MSVSLVKRGGRRRYVESMQRYVSGAQATIVLVDPIVNRVVSFGHTADRVIVRAA